MKHFIILSLFISFALSMNSCRKCDDECGAGKVRIIGTCYDETRPYYFFSGYPDFYCYNDSVAVGIPVNPRDQDVIYIKTFRYLKDKGVGNNYIIGGSTSGDGQGEFLEICNDTPDEKVTYNTFLVVENYSQITKDTRELQCRLELRDKQTDFFEPYKILDSARIVLRRVN